MQFHLNGFRPGDPLIPDTRVRNQGCHSSQSLPAQVDILIVGCGPAGLTLAAQLAAFPGINTRIVDQKSGPLLVGQADGIACRTMEMFEAYGFSQRVLEEAYWVNETSFWTPDPNRRENIVRSARIQDTEDGLSEFPHVTLSQARVHDFYLDVMRNSRAALEPDYSRRFLDLTIEGALSEERTLPLRTYPVSARFERLEDAHKGQVETVQTGFLVGCDGAHSTVRRCLGRVMQGDSANQLWGVMDVLAITDFPDIRLKAVIHSSVEGNLLIIPREGGYLVRLYVELEKLKDSERVSSRMITPDRLIASAQRILRPYKLEVKEVAWWSVYEIGQRLCDKFDDVANSETARRFPRVLIVGDACHTHSPKAGQGMNVSMADAFNLGWKLGSVILGRCSPRVLHTYSDERRAVAQELINFDRKFARMFSAPPRKAGDADNQGIDPAEFQSYFVEQGRFTAGTATHYAPSIISAEPTYQHLAKALVIGMRFHSAPVIRLADAKPLHLAHTMKADGRWRLVIFAAAEDPAAPSSRLQALCAFLGDLRHSPIRKFTPGGADIDSVIDVLAVFQQSHRELAIEAMPAFLLPQKGAYGLRDYEKIFCPDLKSGADIFDLRGIDRTQGCMVIVRPDQYIANVLPLSGHRELSAFFAAFMMQPSP
ncbi:MAG: FAD-binding monooxygenase [Acidobacteria bacterium]|nr:FAD-binding monooxygenase [Acidobacteriota bacterium]